MLAIIPFATFICIFLTLGNLQPKTNWRRVLLRSLVLWGAYVVVVTELFSLLRIIRSSYLALAWGVPLIVLCGWLIQRKRGGYGIAIPSWRPPEKFSERVLLLGVVVILLLTAIVAWKTPPQTWDSMNYHMSRVAHWAQEEAVKPFATGIEAQNSRPPWAEYAILHFYVLAGGDFFANYIEWFAMIGSLIGVSLIAEQLGASQFGKLAAVVFAATLPMGITQASSTMNDYVVALWVVCVAVECLSLIERKNDQVSFIFVSIAAGLALTTKPTSVAYLAPLALWYAVFLARYIGFRVLLKRVLIAVVIVFVINLGYLVRNVSIYSSPLNPNELGLHGGQPHTARVLLSNILRNAALHAGTPSPHVNKGISLVVMKIHDLIGADINDPRTTSAGRFKVPAPSTDENQVGNPLHAYLILGVLGFLIVRRQSETSWLLNYTVAVVAMFFVFSFLFKWQIFGSRYHLPFFVLFAPIAGNVFGRSASRWGVVMGLVLLAATWPWVTGINSRPLIPDLDRAYISGIFTESRQTMYFANGLYLFEPYKDLTRRINEAHCDEVGIMLSGNGFEYPLWVLLGAPRETLEVEWIVAGTPSERYEDPSFAPCAVICENCPQEWEVIRGLPLTYSRSNFQLFLRVD